MNLNVTVSDPSIFQVLGNSGNIVTLLGSYCVPVLSSSRISMFGITVVLYFVKIFSGSRNYQMLRGQNKLLSSSWVG